jgi:TonB dependent receptor-like, beta-barrel/TonB-dependent Receptor Plug Domain
VATRSLISNLVGIALFLMAVSAAATQSEAESLVDVLATLRRSGVDVLYSTDLITPAMAIAAPLHATGALERTREALAPYGLILKNVGENRYLVTRAPSEVARQPVQTPSIATVSPHAPALEEISVYASQYTLGGDSTGEPRSFSSIDLDRIPGDHDNALRATRLLPGVANTGSSSAYIRGSSLEDVLVVFDGVTLTDPFHLKDFQSLLSAFDTAAIGRMDIYSGGFPVRYGTRSGAVIDVTPRSLSSGYEFAAGASLLAYNMSSLGRAEQWPVDWLATVRTSAPDVAERPGNGRTLGAPQFTESVGRLRWHPDADSFWTLGWLLLDDRTSLVTSPVEETSTARYRDEYIWTAYDASVGEELHSRTTLALSDVGRTRDGALFIREVANGSVVDTRKFSRAEFRSDWSFAPLPRLAIESSAEATDSRADLRYNRAERFQDFIAAGFDRPADNSLLAHAAPEEWTYAFSGAARRRWASFEAELGLRVDGQRYEGFASRQQWSPRLNLRYDMAERWHLYGSWGHFTQAQRPEEWRIEGTQSVPDVPELAIHSTLGIAYERSAQTRFGLEAYRKRWTHVSPYYDNTLESLTLVPDLTPDRMLLAPTHSESAGIELSARRAFSPALEGWANYAWSNVVDDFSHTSVRRSWDQSHALTSGLIWTEGMLSAETVVGWHRGWPRTPFEFTPATVLEPPSVTLDGRNSSRWGNYFTLDFRTSVSVPLKRSDFSMWAELTNSTGRHNPCCDRFLPPQAAVAAEITQPNSWFPRAFDLGVTWHFSARH